MDASHDGCAGIAPRGHGPRLFAREPDGGADSKAACLEASHDEYVYSILLGDSEAPHDEYVYSNLLGDSEAPHDEYVYSILLGDSEAPHDEYVYSNLLGDSDGESETPWETPTRRLGRPPGPRRNAQPG